MADRPLDASPVVNLEETKCRHLAWGLDIIMGRVPARDPDSEAADRAEKLAEDLWEAFDAGKRDHAFGLHVCRRNNPEEIAEVVCKHFQRNRGWRWDADAIDAAWYIETGVCDDDGGQLPGLQTTWRRVTATQIGEAFRSLAAEADHHSLPLAEERQAKGDREAFINDQYDEASQPVIRCPEEVL